MPQGSCVWIHFADWKSQSWEDKWQCPHHPLYILTEILDHFFIINMLGIINMFGLNLPLCKLCDSKLIYHLHCETASEAAACNAQSTSLKPGCFSSPSSSLLMFLAKQQMMTQVLGPYNPHSRPDGAPSSWLWPDPVLSLWTFAERGVNEWLVNTSVSLFHILLFKWLNKHNK